MRVLIVGPGYIGLPLAEEMVRRRHDVFGLRRSGDADGTLKAKGIQALIGDITNSASLARLPSQYDWVVNCAASRTGGVEDYQRVYLEGARNLVRWLSKTPPIRYVYTSSTSVYGQNDGSVVDESAVAEPPSETGRVLASTEQILLASALNADFPAIVLRVAGIYGPGRWLWLQRYIAGEARLEGEGRRILNMIHRDDVIGCILAALEHGQAGEIYNAVDDEPVAQRYLYEWLAGMLNRPCPPAVPEDSATLRRRGVTSKRISNQKLKSELGYRFKYPTYREGYAHELRSILRGVP